MDWLHQRFSGRVDGWVIFVTVALVLWMLLDAARRGRPVADAGGSTILFRHHVLFRWIGFLMGFIAPLAIWVLPSPLREEQGDPVSKLIVMAMIAASGLPLWWEGTRFALLVSPRGLDCRSPWRKAHFLPWDQIQHVSYSAECMWFLIEARGGLTFRVPIFIAGISQFLEQCELHLMPGVLAGAEGGYDVIGRPFRRM